MDICSKSQNGTHHAVNRAALDLLLQTGVFNGYKKDQSKRISRRFMVEAHRYDLFTGQEYLGTNKNSPLGRSYDGLTQSSFEVDLRRIFRYEENQKKKEVVNMTDKKFSTKIEKAVQRLRIG
jgi:hypothetical protein